ncbi:MAG: cytochrome c, partial [Flavobacteriales bacterium]
MSNSNSTRTLNTLKGFGLVTVLALAVACGGSDTPSDVKAPSAGATTAPAAPAPGLITADQVKLGDIDQGRVKKGEEIYDVKCQACHSTGTNRVVGPGWKGLL